MYSKRRYHTLRCSLIVLVVYPAFEMRDLQFSSICRKFNIRQRFIWNWGTEYAHARCSRENESDTIGAQFLHKLHKCYIFLTNATRQWRDGVTHLIAVTFILIAACVCRYCTFTGNNNSY